MARHRVWAAWTPARGVLRRLHGARHRQRHAPRPEGAAGQGAGRPHELVKFAEKGVCGTAGTVGALRPLCLSLTGSRTAEGHALRPARLVRSPSAARAWAGRRRWPRAGRLLELVQFAKKAESSTSGTVGAVRPPSLSWTEPRSTPCAHRLGASRTPGCAAPPAACAWSERRRWPWCRTPSRALRARLEG